MSLPDALTATELHIHMAGAYSLDDVTALGRDRYEQIDWHGRDYPTLFEATCGYPPEPKLAFERALNGNGRGHLRRLHEFGPDDVGHFDRFMQKYRFFQHIWYDCWQRGPERARAMLERLVERHRCEGLRYVEYRVSFWGSGSEQQAFLHTLHQFLLEASDANFTARHIMPLSRDEPEASYQMLRDYLQTHPELATAVVGVDFASIEEGYPPRRFRPILTQINRDNRADPAQALPVVYHVGETFFDKSLESAIRWCHEVALMGVARLGHAIVLGLDPAVAVGRRPFAHEHEPVSERLDQIEYDLTFARELARAGVTINAAQLRAERVALTKLEPDVVVTRPYTPQRLTDIRRRQTFVLEQLARCGTVIECCPTSNLRIAAIPSPAEHPIHRFLASDVNLVICSDDPGTFGVTLASEVDWVLTHSTFSKDGLVQRLGDPRRFALPQRPS